MIRELPFRRTHFRGALLLLALVCVPAAVPAITAVPTWQQRWSGSSFSAPYPFTGRELADGSTLVVGYSAITLHAVRYDAGGTQLSASTFTPPFFDSVTSFSPLNVRIASLAAIDPFGGVFVASASNVSSSQGDLWLLKYDGFTGNALWPAPVLFESPSHLQVAPSRLLVDSGGNLIVVAQRSGGTIVLKYEGISGNLLWGPTTLPGSLPASAALDVSGNVFVSTLRSTYRLAGQTGVVDWGPVVFGGPGDTDNVAALAVGPDGNVLVAGSSSGNTEVFKYVGASGAPLWGPAVYTEVSGPALRATGLNVGPSGDAVLSGFSGNQFMVLAYSGTNGTLRWGPRKTAAAAGSPPLTVAITGAGEVVASGWDSASRLSTLAYRGADGSLIWGPETDPESLVDSFRRPLTFVASNSRVVTAAVDFDGTLSTLTTLARDGGTGSVVWSAGFRGDLPSRLSELEDITQGPDGSVFVTGFTYDPTVRFVTFKYARADGAILWGPVSYEVPGGNFGIPHEVRTDSAGDVFVLGSGQDGVVLKYNGTTGALLWSSTLAGAFPAFMVVNDSGDVFVLTQKQNITDSDFATFKLSGATGAPLWGPIAFDGGSGRDEFPKYAAVAPGGDVVVTGVSLPTNGIDPPEWVTLRYSGSTGALVWGPILFTQSGGGSDAIGDMAIDGDGNVIVAGSSFSDNDYHVAVMKYEGATGATLWGPKTVAGTGLFSGQARAMALDASGDIFVSGYIDSSSGIVDFLTAKFHGSDGTLLWGPRLFNGSANDFDVSYELALDSDGNPIVAGNSRNPQRNYDIALIKYDGATGVPIWGPLFAGGPGDDKLPVHNIVVRGKSVVVAGTGSKGFLTAAFDEIFAIATRQEDLPPAYCGRSFAQTLVAFNAAGSTTWSVITGALPPGLALDAASGLISGTPTGVGSFAFRVRAQDSTGPAAERDFVLDVLEGTVFAPILATTNPVCAGKSTTLSVAGSWASYSWLPGGQTTPTISVSPSEATDFAVFLTDGAGCRTRGDIRVSIRGRTATVRAPKCLSPDGKGYVASTEDAGPGASYEWAIINGGITSGSGTRSVVFTAGASGSVTLSVTVTSSDGCATGSGDLVALIGCAAEAEGLVVDAAANGGLSDGNSILEPGETVIVMPAWRNPGVASLPLSGTASALSGPAGAAYSVADPSADYGSVSGGATNDCATASGNCYSMNVSIPGSRPATHWDAEFSETLTDGDPVKVWTLHIGESFTDVPKTHVFYPYVEKLLHNGVTTGCGPSAYCPDDAVFRLQMAIFIARAQAGGDGNVPASGTAQGSPYDCSQGGTSLFSDVEPTNPFCRHVHYIYGTGVTTGCEPGKYCPEPDVTRAQMAMFIARAMAGSDAAVPQAYGPDPATGRSYSCNPGSPNLHFTDVTTGDIFCRHTHYLWAKDVISGFPDNSYQPAAEVTRGAMAKFLANGFNLRLYGP
jgi:WD40 repeat protein